MGGLLPVADTSKNGLMSSNVFRQASMMFTGGNDAIVKVDVADVMDSNHYLYIHSYDRVNSGLYTVYAINTDGYKIKAGDRGNTLMFYKDDKYYYIRLLKGKDFLIELKGDVRNAQIVSGTNTSTLTQLFDIT